LLILEDVLQVNPLDDKATDENNIGNKPFITITEAINNIVSGQKIYIVNIGKPYVENLVIENKNNLNLIGEYGVVIDGSFSDIVIDIDNSKNIVLKNLSITNGKAEKNKTNGGGISIDNDSSVKIINCNIYNNQAWGIGGGIYNNKSSLDLINSNIYGNGADYDGGGLLNYSSVANIINSNFYNNKADRYHDEVYNNNYSSVKMVNSNVWETKIDLYNKYDSIVGNYSEFTVAHSNIYMENKEDKYPGEGNQNKEPFFTNVNAVTENGDPDYANYDFTLKSESECINNGHPNLSDFIDIANFEFVKTNDADGSKLDIGNYLQDDRAPTNYTISVNQDINSNLPENFSFTVSQVEVGASYDYIISDNDELTADLIGKGLVAEEEFTIKNINNIGSLSDGEITISLKLTDEYGNEGEYVSVKTNKKSFMEISLKEGWNYDIAFPVNKCFKINTSVQPKFKILDQSEECEIQNIDEVFSSIAGKYQIISSFDTAPLAYNPDNAIVRNMQYLSPGYAYSIKMKEDGILKIPGNIIKNPTIKLNQGLNYIGYYGITANAFCSLKELIEAKNLEYVSRYNAENKGEQEIFYSTNQEEWENKIKDLKQGNGYFIRVKQETIWEQKEEVFCNETEIKRIKNIKPIIEKLLTYDINGDGKLEAFQDGILVQRYLFGLNQGKSLMGNYRYYRNPTEFEDFVMITENSTRKTEEEIISYIKKLINQGLLDIDGNGEADALTDGLLLMKYMIGYQKEELINNAIDTENAKRRNAEEIVEFIESNKVD